MTLDQAVTRFDEVIWSENHAYFKARCPFCSADKVRVSLVGGKAFIVCYGGCEAQKLRKWLYERPNPNDETSRFHAATEHHLTARPNVTRPIFTPAHVTLRSDFTTTTEGAGGDSSPPPAPVPDPALWKLSVYRAILGTLQADPKTIRLMVGYPEPTLVQSAIEDASRGVAAGVFNPLPALSESEIGEEIDSACRGAVRDFLAKHGQPLVASRNGHPEPAVEFQLPVETLDRAIEANAAYLAREPVVAGLLYSSAQSMITGGKHSGKSTLARFLAICVAKGWPFLGREVQQGPIIYLASGDEEMVARAELIKLGWKADDPIYFIGSSQIPDEIDEEKILKLLTGEIKIRQAKLVVVDMLFDFIPVRDELGYAETRRATGLLQRVVNETGIHIISLHHAPKHMSLSAEAAITALGSQGLAARVSPMILTRRYGPGVHAVVSTDVRDPRGKPLSDSRLLLNPDGTLSLGGDFKTWMLAEVYVSRVLDLFEAEPGSEMTTAEVMEALDLKYQVAKSALWHLFKNGQIHRSGDGKKGRPFRYSVPLTEISPADGKTEAPDLVQVRGTYQIRETPKSPSQEVFSYKEKLSPKPFTPPGDDAPEPEGYGLPDKYGISRGD